MKILTTLMLLAFSSIASATDFVCTNGAAVREIQVIYESMTNQVPCKVEYNKKTEGGTTYPWSAKGQSGFCEEKAAYLADRLRGFGWTCDAKSN